MKIYNYDDLGIFTTEGFADPDPMCEGNFLIPANATVTPPPVCSENECVVWDGEKWNITPDRRGAKFYSTVDGSEIIIDHIGSLSSNLTSEPCPGHAYEWKNNAWVYNIALDSPGTDYSFKDGAWCKTRFTKKEFLLLCGLDKVASLNAGAKENPMLAAVHDILMASEFVDVTDKDTMQLVGLLASDGGGNILSTADRNRILSGVKYEKN